MDNPKDDSYYNGRIISDATFIQEHMKGLDYASFLENEVLQDSMMFRLIQISENARKLTERFRAEKAGIPWPDVFGLRNRIVHEYGGVDLKIVYDTLAQDIPDLKRRLEE